MVSPVSGIYAKVRQKFHLSPLFKFPEPALFDNYKFLVHELFLYCIGLLLKYEQFPAAQEFLDNEYYWDDGRERDNKMYPFVVFREHTRSLEHRNQRLGSRRLSVRADMLKERNAGTGVDFQYVMCADFIAYLRGERRGEYQGWWPETLLYADRYSGPLEIFARAKSQRYFDRIKGLLSVGSKDELGVFFKTLVQKDRLPRWQFETLDPARLVGWGNIATSP
ncbi:hypothetical protein U8C32_21675 (plasmid) [Sinorhizobium medicae]|uniref:hypothetical protein n=1 Tax=Sinorhizobium medicae TaxID=110321 RepID=UPI002AF6A162|nr:hypothetical protein [Sinorhizobium medicae]WQO48054.1 hypothetical protein U8C42_21770 [Sinorhizobium medicae]WQO68411.1 hypothetical protein U8C40_23040 [Sinorhizobium medicae]WQO75471.1 hypothetical protein U8C31_22805 [Sinorhizobium medicae]WQO94664.1 hypothetical protein U8C32_21675 [Sinorhizobium medicae]